MHKIIKRLGIIAIILAGLIAVLPANAQDTVDGVADTPWPMYQHDAQHTGRSPFLGPTQMPELLWTAHLLPCLGFSCGISIAEDGSLLLAIGVCLSRFDPITQQIRWIYNYGDINNCAPLISADGNIYWGYGMTFDQISPSGGTNWSVALVPVFGFNSNPTFGTDGNLYFVHSGLWSFTTTGQYRWFIPYGISDASASPAIGLYGAIYAGTDIGVADLCAYSPLGGISWCLDIPGYAYDRTVAIGSNGMIYVPTDSNNEPPYTDSGVLVAVNPSGSVEWKFQPDEATIFGIQDGIAIAADGSIYFFLNTGYSYNYLYSIDSNGQFRWKVAFSGNPLAGTPSDMLYPITLDRAGNAFICLQNSRCYAISPQGEILWEFEFPLIDSIIIESSTQPILAADGLFYLVDSERWLYAYADPAQYPILRTPTRVVDFSVEPGAGSFTTTIPITSTAMPITYTASLNTPVDWLSIIQPIDVTPAQLTLQFDPAALPIGMYHSSLRIIPSEQAGAWITIPINLNIGIQRIYLPISLNDYLPNNRILYTSDWFVENQLASINQNGLYREVISRDISPDPIGVVYAPDGNNVALVSYIDGRYQIQIMDTETGEIILVIPDPSSALRPAWSPGSDQIAFISYRDDPNNGEVYVINLDGTGLTRLTYDQLGATNISWSPDGIEIAVEFRSSLIYLMNPDGTNPYEIIPSNHSNRIEGWSPDGRNLLLMCQEHNDMDPFQLGVYDVQTGTYTFLTYNIFGGAIWSPDGSRIAYSGFDDGSPNDRDIYIINPDGSGMTNLTHALDNEDSQPVWSPNSEWIAFSSRNDATMDDPNYDIYVIRIDGAGLRQLTKNIQADYYPFWKP